MPRITVAIEDVECVKETALAILVVIYVAEHWVAEHWIPKSQIGDDSEVYGEGHEGTLVVTAWFAEQEGLC